MSLQPNIYYIPNQPTKIDTPSTCEVDTFDFKSIVNADDVTKFQFKLFPRKLAVELLTNTEFNSNLTGWTSTTNIGWTFPGRAYNTSTTSIGQLAQTITNAYADAFLEVTANILTNTNGFQILIGADTTIVPAGVIGEMKFYGMLTSSGSVQFLIYPSGQVGSFVVDYVRMKEVTLDYIILLRNIKTDTVEVAYNLRNYINSTYPNGNTPFRRVKNYVTYEHEWTGYDESCYRFEIADQTLNTNTQNNVYNGNFIVNDLDSSAPYGSQNWFTASVLSTVSITNSQLVINMSGTSSAWGFYIGSTLKNGATYNISIDAATGVGGGTYTLLYGNQSSASTQVLANGADFSGTFVGNGDQLAFTFSSPSGAMTLKFNSISVTLQDENNLEGNYISNDFVLTNTECDTIEISACNDVDSLGFNFPLSNFSLNTRLLGKATNPRYIFDRDAFVNNFGNTRTTYFQRQKVKVIKIDLVPEYMLDFLTLLGGMDHIYINDMEFVADKDEFISINYDENLDNFAKVQLFLFEKDSTAINKVTTALGIGCGADIEYVLDPEDITDPNDDTQIVDPQTGDPIISLS